MRFVLCALFAVAVFGSTLASAQAGGLTIRVTDQDGVTLPGATVTLGSEVGFVKTSASVTNAKGEVQFPVLRPGGGYWIEVAFPSFATVKIAELRVSIGKNEVHKIELFPEMQERVVVVGERDVIDIEQTQTSTKFSDEFISDLPSAGRSYTNVIAMAPGVQDADGDGNPNVHGSRNRDFSAMVSGVRNVDPLTGQRMSEVNPNSIEEMEVITAGAGVEFGRAQGGFANIVQKQGSNEHEGVFEMFLRTSKLDGDGASDNSNLPDTEFESYQPSVHLSGPILRDKIWYSLAHQYFSLDEPRNIVTSVVVVPTRQWSHSDTVTWQVSPRNKLAFQVQADPLTTENVGVSRFRPPSATFTNERKSETYSMTWTAPYSPKILVQSIGSWQDTSTGLKPTEAGVSNNCVIGEQPFLANAQCLDLSTGEVSGSFGRLIEDHRQRLTVGGQATIFAGEFWGADHTLKAGISVENERYFRDETRNPTVAHSVTNIPPEDGSDPDVLNPLIQAFATVAVPQTAETRVTGTNWALYGEDEFKPLQNLSINLGLRVDREEINSEGHDVVLAQPELEAFESAWYAADPSGQGTIPADLWTDYFTGYENLPAFKSQIVDILCEGVPASELGNCQTNARSSILGQSLEDAKFTRSAADREIYNTNLSPRLAVAWSPWSNGKTALKFTTRRQYNLTPLTMPLNEVDPDLAQIEFNNRACEPGSPCILDPSSGIVPSVTVSPIDPDYDTAYVDEFTFTIDRELWAETSIHFDYINRKFRDQPQDRNINLAVGDKGTCTEQLGPANSLDRHPWITQSPGVGQEVVDPLTGEIFFDTDPGFGDGRLDDCVGKVLAFDPKPGSDPTPGAPTTVDLQRPDGRTDLYLQNPLWSDIFLIGNYNESDYEAYQVRLVRRQYRGWELNASYTWSESVGNGEDFNQAIGDDPSLDNFVYGYQSTDVRHSVKLIGTTITPWGIRLGSVVTWQSGLPYSSLLQQSSFDTMPISTLDDGPINATASRVRTTYASGVRNDQRNPSWWNVDLRASKELNLSRGLNMQVSVEVFNALDDDTYFVWNDTPLVETGSNINGVDVDGQQRFGREWQLGMKLAW